MLRGHLFHEHEIDGGDEAEESGDVIPMHALPLEEDTCNDGKDDERHAFLYHLQLHQRERTAVADEAEAVCRHLTAVFEESYRPAEGDDTYQGPVAARARLLQLEMSVPGKGHEDIAQH